MGPVEDRNERLPCVICGAPGTVWLYHPSRARQRTCTGYWAMMNGRNPTVEVSVIENHFRLASKMVDPLYVSHIGRV